MSQNSATAVNPKLEASIASFTGSELFSRTFKEGMALVEETAAYLDGPGRATSRKLPRRVALAYAGESMRLTTRLMQIASWLLLQRAIREGTMTAADAVDEKHRISAQEICHGARLDGSEHLPDMLLELLDRSERLYERVERLDTLMYRPDTVQTPSGDAQQQQAQLAEAFSGEFSFGNEPDFSDFDDLDDLDLDGSAPGEDAAKT